MDGKESMMQIKGGSEKQITWATDIAAGWLGTIDAEIDNFRARAARDLDAGRSDLADRWTVIVRKLAEARERMLAGLDKITAAQVIDLHTRRRNPGAEIVRQVIGL